MQENVVASRSNKARSVKPVLSALLAASVFALSACGGDNSQTAASAPRLAAVSGQNVVMTAGAQLSDYQEVVQRIYVAYFGRPADTSGLPFFEQQFLNAGAPTNVQGVNQAYLTNANVKALVDFFGTSAESQALYSGSTQQFLTAIYHNLYNRDPDAGGLAYWAAKIDSGELTRANAAVSLMAGAQSTDADIISNKVQAATSFTNALDTDQKKAGYDGLSANATVRTMLGTVDNTTNLQAFQATITSTISTLANNKLSSQALAIVTNRCTGCHSASPTIAGYPQARTTPYDTAAQIKAGSSAIYLDAVATTDMPDGNNLTGMTEAERTLLGQWVNAGAP